MEIIPHTDNPTLFDKAKNVPSSDFGSKKSHTLIEEMGRLLALEKYGVALAAPQVGIPLRRIVVSGPAVATQSKSKKKKTEKTDSEKKQAQVPDEVYINPTLVKLSRSKSKKHEGCLSVRGKWGIVPRAEKATIRAFDENGREFTRGASGFLAHIFQHEMDHLEGVLYTDKALSLYDDSEKDEYE